MTELLLPTGPATTPEGLVDDPSFFGGFVAHSGVVAAGILAVADVAGRRWDAWEAGGRSLDPVVTASGDRLRFESLSVCNGVYARFDLLASGIDSGTIGFGTTNVDINPPLRAALSAMGRDELMREVGSAGSHRGHTRGDPVREEGRHPRPVGARPGRGPGRVGPDDP